MKESKCFSKVPEYYHWVPVIFIYLFIYSFLVLINKFECPWVVLLEKGVRRMSCEFSRAYPCVCVLFQESCKTGLLGSCFCIVVLLWVCVMFAEHYLWINSGGLLQNKYNFIYHFQFIIFNILLRILKFQFYCNFN